MVTFIILLALVFIGSYVAKNYYRTTEVLGIVVMCISAFLLFIHLLIWPFVTYNYELFVAQRDAFEQTLNDARENGNEYETAAIVKDVAEWNQLLAASKYQNKIAFLDQYIDDRVETLEPIK